MDEDYITRKEIKQITNCKRRHEQARIYSSIFLANFTFLLLKWVYQYSHLLNSNLEFNTPYFVLNRVLTTSIVNRY